MARPRPIEGLSFRYKAIISDRAFEGPRGSDYTKMSLDDYQKALPQMIGMDVVSTHGQPTNAVIKRDAHGNEINDFLLNEQRSSVPGKLKNRTVPIGFSRSTDRDVLDSSKFFSVQPRVTGRVINAWLDAENRPHAEFELYPTAQGILEARHIKLRSRPEVSVGWNISIPQAADGVNARHPDGSIMCLYKPTHLAITSDGRKEGCVIYEGRCTGIASHYSFSAADDSAAEAMMMSFNSTRPYHGSSSSGSRSSGAHTGASTAAKAQNVKTTHRNPFGQRTSKFCTKRLSFCQSRTMSSNTASNKTAAAAADNSASNDTDSSQQQAQNQPPAAGNSEAPKTDDTNVDVPEGYEFLKDQSLTMDQRFEALMNLHLKTVQETIDREKQQQATQANQTLSDLRSVMMEPSQLKWAAEFFEVPEDQLKQQIEGAVQYLIDQEFASRFPLMAESILCFSQSCAAGAESQRAELDDTAALGKRKLNEMAMRVNELASKRSASAPTYNRMMNFNSARLPQRSASGSNSSSSSSSSSSSTAAPAQKSGVDESMNRLLDALRKSQAY